MPYEPLHHKYRPQRFAELVGQEAIATTLSNALQQQRIAPAYLFTGPRGTGKTSSARILAKSLNCIQSEAPTPFPCGQCEVCRAIARGLALDVIEIDAASNTGVDNIRELIERAQFAPVQCRYKVYIIDEVHMLSTAAFNALLKTLEEPPDRIVFVLATTDPQRVLPTIISRCQRFDFRRIPLEAMVGHLDTIAAKEAIAIHPDAIQLVAQISQGGLRDAESLLDQLSLLEGDVTVERVWDLVGAVPERDLLKLVWAIAQDDAVGVLDQARHLMDRGREPLIVLQNLASFYRDLLVAKTAPDRLDLVAITPPTWAEMREFVQSLTLGTLLLGQQHLRASEVQVKNTTQPRLWLEVTLMGLLPSAISAPSVEKGRSSVPIASSSSAGYGASPSTSAQAPPANAIAAPSNEQPTAPKPLSTPTVQKASPHSAQEAAPPPDISQPVEEADPPADILPPASTPSQPKEAEQAEQADLSKIWQDVLALVQPFSTQMMMRQQCQLVAFSGHEARIGTRSQPLFKMAKDRLPNVEAAFVKLFNRPIRLSLEVLAAAESRPGAEAQSTQSTHKNAASPVPPQAPPSAHPPQTQQGPSTPASLPPPQSSEPAIAPPLPPEDPSPQAPPPTQLSPTSPSAPPDLPTPSPYWQDDDEVLKAAKSLAQMFNGQIVSLDGDLEPDDATNGALISAPALDDTEVGEVDSDDEDDIPF